MEKAAEGYREGEKSIEAAAETAKVSIWEMVDYMQKNNIGPPAEDKEEIGAEFEEAEKI